MASQDINVNTGDREIEITLNDQQIEVQMSSITTASFVEADVLFSLNGAGSTTGLKYNSSSGDIEFYINNVLVGAFNPNAEDNPFV